jgi:hypothetical protein
MTLSFVALTALMTLGSSACIAGDDADELYEDIDSSEQTLATAAAPSKADTGKSFCDTSPDHGSTKSCDKQGPENLECPDGSKPTKVTCRKVGQSCEGGDGTWCQNCKIKCKKVKAVEAVEIDAIEFGEK